ncbi:hypothetical protein SMNM65_04510 [Streptococcus mitis]|uniref:Uncharacterized protein n=1 Tax=Streptococcus mitis TaxID=28037 RepID=A0A7G1IRE4_STRMT|nr:hypothetical protein SMNM65_04510 [Streptococcus mitis]
MINKKQFRIFTIVDLDKEEEYLHEMHLKGWRYRTSHFGFSILTNVNQTMLSTVSMILDFLKNISMNCKILEIEVGN